MPTISVIVPVYKVEAYLDRCVQSVLDQAFEDFELILVDDGSPDRCGEMCDEWAKKDNRIRVIHKPNGGLSDARNAGIDIAQSEWLTFIDSDDYVHPKMLEALYHAVIEHNVKVSICGYAETHGEPLVAEDFTAKLWLPADFYRQRNVNATIACGKLYHKDVVLKYPVGKLHEDEYISYRILFGLDQVAVLSSALYGYFQNDEGIVRSEWSKKKLDALAAFEEQIVFFRNLGYKELLRWRIRGYMRHVLWQLEVATSVNKLDLEGIEALEKCGRRILRIYWKDHVFVGDGDMWIYARFYPRITKLYCMFQVVWRKLCRR